MWLAVIVSATMFLAVMVSAWTSFRIAVRAEIVAAKISPSTLSAGSVLLVGLIATGAVMVMALLVSSGEMRLVSTSPKS